MRLKRAGSPAKIYKDIKQLRKRILKSAEPAEIVVATSGGFDPMHVGHLRCIQDAAELGDILVVIVNSDGFLQRKKGFSFMPHQERMEIIAGITGVDYVVGWDDGSQTVTDALDILQPAIFAKGGDRDAAANVPEYDLCAKIGCEVKFNIGGGKIQSSSNLISNSAPQFETGDKKK
jgi:cytidyltransferase-like protein